MTIALRQPARLIDHLRLLSTFRILTGPVLAPTDHKLNSNRLDLLLKFMLYNFRWFDFSATFVSFVYGQLNVELASKLELSLIRLYSAATATMRNRLCKIRSGLSAKVRPVALLVGLSVLMRQSRSSYSLLILSLFMKTSVPHPNVCSSEIRG